MWCDGQRFFFGRYFLVMSTLNIKLHRSIMHFAEYAMTVCTNGSSCPTGSFSHLLVQFFFLFCVWFLLDSYENRHPSQPIKTRVKETEKLESRGSRARGAVLEDFRIILRHARHATRDKWRYRTISRTEWFCLHNASNLNPPEVSREGLRPKWDGCSPRRMNF